MASPSVFPSQGFSEQQSQFLSGGGSLQQDPNLAPQSQQYGRTQAIGSQQQQPLGQSVLSGGVPSTGLSGAGVGYQIPSAENVPGMLPATQVDIVQQGGGLLQRHVNPPVVNQNFAKREVVEVTPVVERERIQPEIFQVLQQRNEVVQAPGQVQLAQLTPEIREFRSRIPPPSIAPPLPLQTSLPLVNLISMKPPIVKEHVIRNIIEEIQPVINREIRSTSVIRATQPIIERVWETPRVAEIAAPVSLNISQQPAGLQMGVQQQQPLYGGTEYGRGLGGRQVVPELGFQGQQQQFQQQSPWDRFIGQQQAEAYPASFQGQQYQQPSQQQFYAASGYQPGQGATSGAYGGGAGQLGGNVGQGYLGQSSTMGGLGQQALPTAYPASFQPQAQQLQQQAQAQMGRGKKGLFQRR